MSTVSLFPHGFNGVHANPAAHEAIIDPDDGPKVRRLLCVNYNGCLEIASKNNWEGFTCNKCMCYQAISAIQMEQDQEGLIGLMAEIAGQKGNESYAHSVYGIMDPDDD